jgi:hypothetical protein
MPRPLHECATIMSLPQRLHKSLEKPARKTPQRKNRLSSSSTYRGSVLL